MTTFNVKGCVFLMRGFALSGVTHFFGAANPQKTKNQNERKIYTMKKKILSIMLTLSMLAMFMPCIASAEGYGNKGTPYDGHMYYEVNGSSVTISDYNSANYYDGTRDKRTEIVIPDEIDGLPVTSIGDYAFDGCDGITSVTIPNSVTSIGKEAFMICRHLTNVTIPDSVTSIGESAFHGCEDLKSVTIPDSVTNIGNYAFAGCWALETVTLSHNITNISEHMFRGCENLKDITIPDSVTSIDKWAFSGCNFTSITIPNSVTTIGNNAFNSCDLLKSITIPNSVANIDDSAFEICSSLENITIPDSVTTIGNNAFGHCTSLTSITIPDSVTSIGAGTFMYCNALTGVTISDSVTSIGDWAFKGCTSLTNITLPDSVKTIGSGAFDECHALTEVSIPDGAMYIASGYTEPKPGERAFPENVHVTIRNTGTSDAQPMPAPEDTLVTPVPTAAPTEEPAPQPTTAPQTGSFTDVPETHWAYDNIMRITELGGFTGYEDGTFKPDNQITHEEFLTVVMKLTYNGDVNAAPASALSDGWADWAKATLNAAVDAGIVTSEDTDLLAVNTPITRAEMAKIISRTLDYLGKAKAANPDTSKIIDWNYVAEVYRPFVADAYSTGIISGYNDGSFGPAKSLTRAEASAVIIRMIDAK